MRVLTYADLDTSAVSRQYEKVRSALERGDYRSAELKKLVPGPYFRAKLDASSRLLIQFVKYQGEQVCLILEVIFRHNYGRSRFLRGAELQWDRIEELPAVAEPTGSVSLNYLNPGGNRFRVLDRVLSLDDAQEAVMAKPLPLVVVGSAGSGKTALTLLRMGQIPGKALYLTQSGYLAQLAEEMYRAGGYGQEQSAHFLSFSDYLRELGPLPGREVDYRQFRGWFEACRKLVPFSDAHQLYEEFRGVIGSRPGGVLSLEAYLGLGLRESLFSPDQRRSVHDLFLRYQEWLSQEKLFDSTLLAVSWQERVRPAYDLVVIDEVQDLTQAQVALALRSLREPGNFLLCGDSNQIVHANFFSWSAIRRLFWEDRGLAPPQGPEVLRGNFRNSAQVTRLCNAILKVKHARFGSVDRESNFLIEAESALEGSVELWSDDSQSVEQLAAQASNSASLAVLVLRDDQKAAARRRYRTPLVFSVQEAKGMEYPAVILDGFISAEPAIYAEIARGVEPLDLLGEGLSYRRSRDRSDRSLERFKFYINSLYVAASRAVQSLYWVEQAADHPLLRLLGLQVGQRGVAIPAPRSSQADWARAAEQLEARGKLEQARDIRQTRLGSQDRSASPATLYWEVLDEAAIARLRERAYGPVPSVKAQRMVFEYAAWHGIFPILQELAGSGFGPAITVLAGGRPALIPLRRSLWERHVREFEGRGGKQVLWKCERYGVDYRTPLDATPLMLAALAGNPGLVDALLERGGNPDARDHFGHTAALLALARAAEDSTYSADAFAAVWERLAPLHLDLRGPATTLRITPDAPLWFPVVSMLARFKELQAVPPGPAGIRPPRGFAASDLLRGAARLSQPLGSKELSQEQLRALLARNTARAGDLPALFCRLARGHYSLHPSWELLCEGTWRPISELLNYRQLGLALDAGSLAPGAAE